MNDETKTPEVEVIAEPVVPVPVVAPPVIEDCAVPAADRGLPMQAPGGELSEPARQAITALGMDPDGAGGALVQYAKDTLAAVSPAPLEVKVVAGTITTGTIVAADANISTPECQSIKIPMPVKRTVIDVMREPQTINFQALTIEAKFVDGLPALVFSADDGERPLTVLAGRNGRFVVEY